MPADGHLPSTAAPPASRRRTRNTKCEPRSPHPQACRSTPAQPTDQTNSNKATNHGGDDPGSASNNRPHAQDDTTAQRDPNPPTHHRTTNHPRASRARRPSARTDRPDRPKTTPNTKYRPDRRHPNCSSTHHQEAANPKPDAQREAHRPASNGGPPPRRHAQPHSKPFNARAHTSMRRHQARPRRRSDAQRTEHDPGRSTRDTTKKIKNKKDPPAPLTAEATATPPPSKAEATRPLGPPQDPANERPEHAWKAAKKRAPNAHHQCPSNTRRQTTATRRSKATRKSKRRNERPDQTTTKTTANTHTHRQTHRTAQGPAARTSRQRTSRARPAPTREREGHRTENNHHPATPKPMNQRTSDWCEKGDSNPHGLPRQNLNRTESYAPQ
ncbi:hypothetical protein SAMN05660880_01338 [Luteibacter sp. 22Crub2.1]|nr:hypothetical protein SAMN05660880_01338 [Luteibacter sp. 22Crub2.1]